MCYLLPLEDHKQLNILETQSRIDFESHYKSFPLLKPGFNLVSGKWLIRFYPIITTVGQSHLFCVPFIQVLAMITCCFRLIQPFISSCNICIWMKRSGTHRVKNIPQHIDSNNALHRQSFDPRFHKLDHYHQMTALGTLS